MSSFICLIVGFVGGIILCFISDRWRVDMLINKGYDNAVKDILEYGCYYDKNNSRVDLGAAYDFKTQQKGADNENERL